MFSIAGESSYNHQGSSGASSTGAVGSECNPVGRNGNLKVPLFGFGFADKESQMML